MFCTTCGGVIPRGQHRCQQCGTLVGSTAPGAGAMHSHAHGAPGYGHAQPHGHSHLPAYGPGGMQMAPAPAAYGPMGEAMGLCPRCAFQGVGEGYFSRGENVAKLVLITLVVWIGGPIYYLVRKDHKVCPNCGLKWGQYGRLATQAALGAGGGRLPAPMMTGPQAAMLPGEGGSRWSGGAIFFWLMAALLTMVGIAEMAAPALFIAAALGGAGFALQKRRDRKREARREMLIAGLQQHVLQLAASRGGKLTVTEVASAMQWPIPRAEKILNSLDDGFRVVSDVTDQGVIVYEFRELAHAPRAGHLPPPSAAH